MSSFHHGADETAPINEYEHHAMRRLLDELTGKVERAYPQGRISGDDLGETAFAVAADPDHGIIRIQFAKPMTWLGLDRQTAVRLVALLQEKIDQLEER